jgi:hypothetical protein
VKHTEQSNVEFWYQLSICSETKENHGKPRSQDLADANSLLASSPALNTRTPTSVPGCAVALFGEKGLLHNSFLFYMFR